jgi:hypothetical protein
MKRNRAYNQNLTCAVGRQIRVFSWFDELAGFGPSRLRDRPRALTELIIAVIDRYASLAA